VWFQIAVGTDDVYKTAEAVKAFGGKLTREPGPLPGISTKITACLDPDGWKSVCGCLYKLLFFFLWNLGYLISLCNCVLFILSSNSALQILSLTVGFSGFCRQC
jgi:hypothetical protein